MLNVKIIMTIVINAGINSVQSEKSIRVIGPIMKIPITMSAVPYAWGGTDVSKGAMNSASRNSPATTREVKPVRPPSSTGASELLIKTLYRKNIA
jgi:hypothetical protein